jgi:integrase
MAKRRGHNEGSIYRRADGKWVGAISLGIQGEGLKRKCKVADTRKEISDWLKPTLVKAQGGGIVTGKRQTVAQFLEQWLADCAKVSVQAGTFASYEQQIKGHIIPALGGLQLSQLTAQHIQKYMTDKRAGLSATTVRYQRTVLRIALKQAEEWGLVSSNAAAKVKPPQVTAHKVEPMELKQVRAFLDLVEGHYLSALFNLYLALGLRRGEALGLRWKDVDLDAGTLRTAQSLSPKRELKALKTGKAHHTFDLGPGLIAKLRAHKTRQLEDRMAMGDKWTDSGLVFTTHKGTSLNPNNVWRALTGLLDNAKLPHFSIHALRHQCATLRLAQGDNLKAVSELLGHSSTRITGDIYAHVLPSQRKESAEQHDRLLFGR